MNCKKFCSLLVSLLLLAALSACSKTGAEGTTPAMPAASLAASASATSAIASSNSGEIFLYGEEHGIKKIIDKEFEFWQDYYDTQGMRHLFIEIPYYTAEFLNSWMQEDDDTILNAIYDDWDGTSAHNPNVKALYQKIKKECPETIFHGTDVGHQSETTGERYLQTLAESGQKYSEQYRLAQEAVRQGEIYYEKYDEVYRENTMVENFIREFDLLNGENIMGIYGSAHTGIEAMEFCTGAVPCMANQLSVRYGAALHSEDLSWLAKDSDR
ncbi:MULTISPECIES: hypothetical protein [unclassified Oscillibacter]|uniref:hypothetical protein n=1 Tax=unclassified Oscillibacter TaxID=2629304 RepID=UPI0025FE22B5|nr:MULTISPECIES: hypothetical protein [unclassified Oscillibacter]